MIRDAHFANESPGMAEHTLTSENSPIQAERSARTPWIMGWSYINSHDAETDWLEVPIPHMLGLYILGLFFRGYPQNSYGQKYGTFT